jgi:hypothetical protein
LELKHNKHKKEMTDVLTCTESVLHKPVTVMANATYHNVKLKQVRKYRGGEDRLVLGLKTML